MINLLNHSYKEIFAKVSLAVIAENRKRKYVKISVG
jgi:hypothetical protein